MEFNKEELKNQMKEDFRDPENITFFLDEAKRMTGFAGAFDDYPERRQFFRGSVQFQFRVYMLALETISKEFPEKKAEAKALIIEMQKREDQIKHMFNLKV